MVAAHESSEGYLRNWSAAVARFLLKPPERRIIAALALGESALRNASSRLRGCANTGQRRRGQNSSSPILGHILGFFLFLNEGLDFFGPHCLRYRTTSEAATVIAFRGTETTGEAARAQVRQRAIAVKRIWAAGEAKREVNRGAMKILSCSSCYLSFKCFLLLFAKPPIVRQGSSLQFSNRLRSDVIDS